MSKSLVYLASPYSHSSPEVREQRFVAACKAAARLMREGKIVFCPIAHSHPLAVQGGLEAVAHDFWMNQDLTILDRCDSLTVLRLEGWTESRGVADEMARAAFNRQPIEFINE